MKKNEILIYMAIAFCVLFISGYVVISNLLTDSGDSSSKEEAYSENGAKKPKRRKKRKWKNYASKARSQKEFIPEGVDIDLINTSLLRCKDTDQRINLLQELFGTKHAKILEIVERELDHPDEDVRLEALDLLSEFGTDEIFDNLSKALDDKSANLREAAIDLLDTVEIKGGSAMEADLITRGLNDESEDVRDAAINVLSDKPKFELEIVAKTAIKSPHDSIKEDVLNELSNRPSQVGVEIMIEGLLDKNHEFRDDVKDELEYITDKEFSSYKEAKEWWSKNKSRFEEEFTEYDDDED